MAWLKKYVITQFIDSASPSELNEIAMAVLKRYSQLYEDEEVIFLSLPKSDLEERQRITRSILSMEA